MKKHIATIAAIGLFAAGFGLGNAGQKIAASSYQDKPKQEAARVLLDIARVQAGKGSWERIAVGRVYYLGGYKAEGQAIFDSVLGSRHQGSDVFRIARVYREAGDWAKAKPLFDRYVASHPKDEKEMAEVGAYYLLEGDRTTAEGLFARSFAIADELWATLSAAGAYLGVAPQE